MKEVKIYLSAELDTRFRKAAMERFGYGRGSLSKAAQEALLEWCRSHEKTGSIEKRPSGDALQTEKAATDEKSKPPQSAADETSLPNGTPLDSLAGSP